MNGTTTLLGCKDDFECPVGFMCYEDVSWSPIKNDSFCDCHGWLGFKGDDCMEFGPTTYFIFTVCVIYVSISSVLFLITLWDLITSLIVFRGKFPLSTVTFTHTITGAGLFSFVVWHVFYFLEAYFPSMTTENGHLAGENQTRISYWGIYTRVWIVATQVCTLMSAMNVSVLWVEIAKHARSESANQMIVRITYYRRAVNICQAIFAGCMIFVGALGQLELAAVVATPFMVLILITFVVGRVKLVSLLDEALSIAERDIESSTAQHSMKVQVESEVSTRDKALNNLKTHVDKTRKAMIAIKRCSFHVCVSLTFLILVGMLFFFMTILPRGTWKEFAGTHNRLAIITVSVNFIPLALLWALGAVFLYTHRSIRKLIKLERMKNDQRKRRRDQYDFSLTADQTAAFKSSMYE